MMHVSLSIYIRYIKLISINLTRVILISIGTHTNSPKFRSKHGTQSVCNDCIDSVNVSLLFSPLSCRWYVRVQNIAE